MLEDYCLMLQDYNLMLEDYCLMLRADYLMMRNHPILSKYELRQKYHDNPLFFMSNFERMFFIVSFDIIRIKL